MSRMIALLRNFLVLTAAAESRASRKRCVPLKYLRAMAAALPWVVASILGAQQPQAASPKAPPAPHHSHRRATLENRVRVLARSLNLDQIQQGAVLKILQARQDETLRIRRDTSISGSARIDQFRSLQDKTVRQIRSVLNEEQKKMYDPLAVRTLEPAEDQKTIDDWLQLNSPK